MLFKSILIEESIQFKCED